MTRFEVYKDRRGGWRWRLVVSNGKTVADSAEGYSRRSKAIRAAKAVIAQVRQAIELRVKGEVAGWIL